MRTIAIAAGLLALVACDEAARSGDDAAAANTAAPAEVDRLRAVAVTASSTSTEWEGEGQPASVVDGDGTTRWSSTFADDQLLTIDYGSLRSFDRIAIDWEVAAAKVYAVEVSADGERWREIARREGGGQGPRTDAIAAGGAEGRYLRLKLEERVNDEWGFSIYEIRAR